MDTIKEADIEADKFIESLSKENFDEYTLKILRSGFITGYLTHFNLSTKKELKDD